MKKNKDLNNILSEFDKLSSEAKQIVLTMAEFIMKVDGKIDEGEKELLNTFKKRLKSIDDVNKKLVIYTIYAVAAADGKVGGGLNKLAPKMLNISLEEIKQNANVDNIINIAKNLNNDAKEALATIAEFTMKLDGKEDPREKEIVEKIKSC